MSRKMYTEAELNACLVSGPRDDAWLNVYKIQTESGPRELARRHKKDGVPEVHAGKVLPLIVDNSRLRRLLPHGHCSLKKFCKKVKKIGVKHLAVPFLAADRGITYFETELRLRENWVIEIPGGIVNHNEEFTIGAVRELLEELGLKKKQVLAYANLLPHPTPFDTGTHVEWTQITVALCFGEICPQVEEGIHAKHCRVVPLAKSLDFLRRMDERGIGIEGQCYTALYALEHALFGKWKKFR